jgi:hypothetical protein
LNVNMPLAPAVIVHGRADTDHALAIGHPVTLLSAPGAALYAGCLWWHSLLAEAARRHPDVAMTGLLDCADAAGQALAALRIGVRGLVLEAAVPGRARVALIAASYDAMLLEEPPPALDMAARGALRRLPTWLAPPGGPAGPKPPGPGDSNPALG